MKFEKGMSGDLVNFAFLLILCELIGAVGLAGGCERRIKDL